MRYLTSKITKIILRALSTIRNAFDNYNNEVNHSFDDINIIFAEVRLIKCKFDNTSVDISLNNLTGISKVLFFDFLEKIILDKFKDKFLFKRTLILIKAWCYYEGIILGSNVGLMASYALEVLVAYVFNKFPNQFKTEVEALFTFFKVISAIDWGNSILSIYGTLSNFDNENVCLCYPWYVDKVDLNTDEYVIDPREFKNFVNSLDKFLGLEWNKNFLMKNLNIVDPLCANNNLGKSINIHNYSKIKKVFELTCKEIESILVIRKENDACNYLNSLVSLFQKTFTNYSPELFLSSLMTPKIIIPAQINKGGIEDEDNSSFLSTPFNSSLDKFLVVKFNKLFQTNQSNLIIKEQSKKYNMITKEILDTILNKLEQVWTTDYYFFPNLYQHSEISEILLSYK